jgi:putative hydrolase of the HAD superfamily
VAVKLLCFDLDDTLWPCSATIMAAENKLYHWMQQHVPQITEQHDINSLRDRRVAFMREHPAIAHDLTQMRLASMRSLADEFGLAHDWVEPGFELYYRARQQVTLYADVAPTLDTLHRRFRLAAITNGNADIHLTGVGHWFEFAVSAAGVGKAKPHPAIFEALLDQASVNAAETVLIGDDPQRDIFGACQLGMRTVWVNRAQQDWTHPHCQPDAQVTNFNDLADILRQLEA